jgi:hypothetical protein
VFFYQSKVESTEGEEEQRSRMGRIFIYSIIAMLAYLTLLVTPYLNLNIKKLSICGCVVLMGKYACELMTFTHFLMALFELGSIVLDVIGSSIFYLVAARTIQVISERNGVSEQTGRMFAVFSGLYTFSILLGYAVAFICVEKAVPVWLFLIILACFTALSTAVCYFTFPTG